MGIQNLKKVIEPTNTVKKVNFSHLKGKTIGIDTSLYMYKFMNITNKNTHFLQIFLYQIYALVSNNVTPIYVFDGKAPVLKNEVLETRKKEREEKEKTGMKMILPKKTDYDQLQQMFDDIGIKYVIGNTECDKICSKMYDDKVIDCAMTEDTDFLTHGIGEVLMGYTIFQEEMYLYNLKDILKSFDISYDQFVDMCIMLGCDYCKKIPKVGMKTCLSVIKEYKTIEKYVEEKKIEYDLERLNIARELFKNHELEYTIIKKEYNEEKANEWIKKTSIKNSAMYINALRKHHGLPVESILPVMEDKKKKTKEVKDSKKQISILEYIDKKKEETIPEVKEDEKKKEVSEVKDIEKNNE